MRVTTNEEARYTLITVHVRSDCGDTLVAGGQAVAKSSTE